MNEILYSTEPNRLEVERLRTLVSEYESRLLEIDRQVAFARHEIANPLSGIIGQAQLLIFGGVNDEVRQRVETIERLAKSIRDHIKMLQSIKPLAHSVGPS